MPSARSNSKPKAPKSIPQPLHEWTFSAIGTEWWIGIYQQLPAAKFAKLQQHIAERIEAFDKTYSRFRADSLVTQIAQRAGDYTFPADSTALFALYHQLYSATDGLFTPLIGQALSDAGYDISYSLKPSKLTNPPTWDEVLQVQDNTLTTAQPVLLDFGAAGKGYLVDLVKELFVRARVNQFCIDASGDMSCSGLSAPLLIGLEHPQGPGQIIGVCNLQEGALCGSASNRRKWDKYHHILNPKTLESVRGTQAVWVTAKTALLADGLATALFFMPPEQLQAQFHFAYCVVHTDNTVQYSADFPAEFFK